MSHTMWPHGVAYTLHRQRHSESRQRRLPSICIPCFRESNMKYNIKKGGRAQCSTPQLPKCHGACGPYPPGPTGPQVTVSSGSSWAGRGSITQILLGEPPLSDLESHRCLTWSMGITRDVSHNDKEKFCDRIFGNSPRSGCAHFQNSSSFIISKLFVIFKNQIVFKIQIFSSLSEKQQFHAVCCQIGDRHQMPYTNIHCSVLVYAISTVFIL